MGALPLESKIILLMMNRMQIGKLTTPMLFIGLFFIILIFASSISYNPKYVTLPDIGLLSIFSLIIFSAVCFLGFVSDRNYIFFLPLQLLAMPAPVDDFFLSVLLTSVYDVKQIYFPIITHIDIYLALGIFRKIILVKPRIYKGGFVLPILLLLMFFVLLSNLLFSVDYWDFFLLLAHTYHFRYLLLLLILSYYYNFSKYENPIIYGIILAIALVFSESLINTYILEGERLVSGTLGNNSYANIMAAIMFFFIWLHKYNQLSRKIIYPTLVLLLIIILATQTRMALIAPFFVLLVYFIYSLKKNFLLRFVKLIAMLSIFFFAYIYLVNNDYISKRYSISQVLNSKNGDVVLNNNAESSSILTRIMLFNTSIKMIEDNPIDGIGVGRFNRYKKDYGFKYNVLIDSHNDLLSLTSQYGIIVGLLFLFCMTLLPLVYYLYYLKNKINNKLVFLFIINFSMVFSGLTNAALMKHQIFAFLAFNLIVLYSIVKTNRIEDSKKLNFNENSNIRD